MAELVYLVHAGQQRVSGSLHVAGTEHDGCMAPASHAGRCHPARFQRTNNDGDPEPLFEHGCHVAEGICGVAEPASDAAGGSVSILSRRLRPIGIGFTLRENACLKGEERLAERSAEGREAAALLQGLVEDGSVFGIEVLNGRMTQEHAWQSPHDLARAQ